MEYPEKASSWCSLRNCWMETCLQIGKQLEELLCPHLPQLAKPRPAFCRCAFQPGTLPHSSTAMVTRKHLAYMGQNSPSTLSSHHPQLLHKGTETKSHPSFLSYLTICKHCFFPCQPGSSTKSPLLLTQTSVSFQKSDGNLLSQVCRGRRRACQAVVLLLWVPHIPAIITPLHPYPNLFPFLSVAMEIQYFKLGTHVLHKDHVRWADSRGVTVARQAHLCNKVSKAPRPLCRLQSKTSRPTPAPAPPCSDLVIPHSAHHFPSLCLPGKAV